MAGRGAIARLIAVDALARVSYGMARTPVLPLYVAFLGGGPALVGLVGAASVLTGVVFKLPAGAVSDRWGRRRMLFAGLAVFAAGPFLYLAVRGPAALIGVRLFHGLATAIYAPVAMAAVAALAGARRGEAISWLSNTKILGKLAGAFLGGVVLSLAVGAGSYADWFSPAGLAALVGGAGLAAGRYTSAAFNAVYLVCGAFGVGALILGATVLRDRRLEAGVVGAAPPRRPAGEITRPTGSDPIPSGEPRPRLWSGLRETAGNARVLLASGCEAVQNLTVGMLEHFLPLYAVFGAGLSPFEASVLYASQAATTIAAKPLFGRWSDRHGRTGVIVLGMLFCALPFAVLPWEHEFIPLLALCLLFGLGEALVTSSSAALVADLCRKGALGAAMGVFGTIKDAGHALGPLLGGGLIALVAETEAARRQPAAGLPYKVAFGAIAALLLAYTVVFVIGNRRVRSRKSEVRSQK